MKKSVLALIMVLASLNVMALSRSKVREYARFLSDRMAYELDLSSMQYNDCYEINYDFIDAVGDYLDDMERGYSYAIDRYYTYLDYRNEDLSYVLDPYQYNRFVATETFYRPFCVYDGSWAFRPYMTYSNHTHFYMSLPIGFKVYIGGHARRHYSSGYYVNRYRYDRRPVFTPIRGHNDYGRFHRRDFGPVQSGHGVAPRPNVRPGHSVRPMPPTRPAPSVRPVQPVRPQTRPDRPSDRPQARPDRPQTRPERPNARPDRPQTQPDRPQTQPSRPQTRPDQSQGNPGRPQVRPDNNRKDSPREGGGGNVSRRGRG